MENLRVNIQRRAADLEFLKNCRDNKVLSKFPGGFSIYLDFSVYSLLRLRCVDDGS
jgi:hypothetical protein